MVKVGYRLVFAILVALPTPALAEKPKEDCSGFLAWMKRPRFSMKAMLAGTAAVAVGMGYVYPTFVEDHIERVHATTEALDYFGGTSAPQVPIVSEAALDSRLSHHTRIMRMRNLQGEAHALLSLALVRNPELATRFDSELGDLEQTLNYLAQNDQTLYGGGKLGATRDKFDQLAHEALRTLVDIRGIDWDQSEMTTRELYLLIELQTDQGRAVLELRKWRHGIVSQSAGLNQAGPWGEVVLEQIRSGKIDPALARVLFEEANQLGRNFRILPPSSMTSAETMLSAIREIDSRKPQTAKELLTTEEEKRRIVYGLGAIMTDKGGPWMVGLVPTVFPLSGVEH